MVASSTGSGFAARPLSPGEKYFAFLDGTVPMNMMFVADLDVALPADLVRTSWPRFSARRAVTRLRVRRDLTLADGPPSQDVVVRDVPSAQWDGVLTELSCDRIGLDRPMRCVYLRSPGEGRSRLVLVLHHAVADGRVCVVELQLLTRLLDGQDVPEHDALTTVLEPRDTWPWQHDRRELLTLLRAMAARNTAAGEPQPRQWARPAGPRRPQFVSLTCTRTETAALFAGAKARGTRAYPAVASAWLAAAARALGDGAEPVFALGTPADVNPPGAAGRVVAPAVGVIATRHAVPADPWLLAPRVGAAVDAARACGEDALFLQLTRAATIGDLDAGTAATAQAIAAAAPAVSVTNIGVVDPGSDPEWVRSVCGYLAPSPNQVAFVSGSGYRGRLVQSVSYDAGQLDAATAAALVREHCELVRRMGTVQAEQPITA